MRVQRSLADVGEATLWLERAGIDASAPVALHLESSAAVNLSLAADWPGVVLVTRGMLADLRRSQP